MLYTKILALVYMLVYMQISNILFIFMHSNGKLLGINVDMHRIITVDFIEQRRHTG